MPVPVIVLDGSAPYGSPTILASNGQTYILENFNVSRAVDTAQDRKATGAPNRQRKTAGFDTFSANLQAPAGSANYPKFGDTFSLTVDDNYGAELWCFDPVNIEQTNDPSSIRKVPVTGFKVFNGSVTTVAA